MNVCKNLKGKSDFKYLSLNKVYIDSYICDIVVF